MPRFVVEITEPANVRAAPNAAVKQRPCVPDVTWIGSADSETAATAKAYGVWDERYDVDSRPVGALVRVVQLDG